MLPRQPDSDSPLNDLDEWEDDLLRRYPDLAKNLTKKITNCLTHGRTYSILRVNVDFPLLVLSLIFRKRLFSARNRTCQPPACQPPWMRLR